MRRELGIAIGVVLGATIFLFWPMVWGALIGEPRFFEWDVPEQYWPDLVYLCESAHRGELPYWNPYDRGGYPFFADPQSAAYHPTSWLVCGIAGPSPALGWASARVVFGFAIAGLFGLLWLRRLGAPWSGAIAGAIVIEAAPFMRHNWELNLTHGLAYLPLMLWAAERVATERKIADGVMLALAIALCGWVGSPPALWLSITMTVLYLAFRLGEQRRFPALPIALAMVFTIGLLGAVLVPAAELAEHSVQAGRSFESIADESLTLERTLAFFWPQSGNHLYVGWIALALGVIALAARAETKIAYFCWAIAIVAVLLAMGSHGPLFRFAFDHVSGVAMFRLPHRYEAWLGPAFGALTAIGLGSLREKLGDRRLRIAAAIAAIAAFVAMALAPGLGPAMFLLALAAVLFARTIEGGIASPALGALLAILILADVSQEMPEERHMRAGPDPCADEYVAAPGTRDRWRVMDEFVVSCRSGTRYRRRDLRGYQDPLILASYERVVGSLSEHPELAAQFNVRYALQGPHFIHGWNRHYLPLPEERERTIREISDALPFAYFVPMREVERATGRQEALARTIELAPSAIAIVEGMGNGTATHSEPTASGTHLSYSPDALSFRIDAPEDGVVVINEAYYPGWRAWIDGNSAPIHRANGFVRAVHITQGRHRVRMSFEPESGRTWRVVLAISLLAALVILALRTRGVR